jgi:hypothetical protein
MNADEVLARLDEPLSLRRRMVTVAALLGGLAAAAVTGLLWATEPALPLRTQVAFAGIVVIGLAWAGYGAWALTRRTPLFALERVVAAWLGVGATAILAAATVLVTTLRHRVEPSLLVAAGTLGVLAVANLVRANRHRAALLRRKRELGG